MLKSTVNLGKRIISERDSPYVIAEIGSNFNQSFDIAQQLMDVAMDAGADAVKFQLFQADILYPNHDGYYDVFKSIELNPEWVPKLKDEADQRGLDFTASPFDRDSVDVLESAGVPYYKLASSETTNLSLLHYIASKNRPLIVSTGMCDMIDVEEALAVIQAVNNTEVVLLQCGSLYPQPSDQIDLNVMKTYYSRFGCPVGFSDHTLDNIAAIVSVGAGAMVLEKHITLDKKSGGPDHFYALEPDQFRCYVKNVRTAHLALGDREKNMFSSERQQGRREGLYASRDLAPGEMLTDADINIRRPAIGIRKRFLDAVLGTELRRAVAKDQAIYWSDLD